VPPGLGTTRITRTASLNLSSHLLFHTSRYGVCRGSSETSHSPSRKHGNLFAVQPKAVEAPFIPSDSDMGSIHHLIPVAVLSAKIPRTGRIFIESVKVYTSESRSFANDAPFELSTADVFAHCTRI
jgi:hypothetical protein